MKAAKMLTILVLALVLMVWSAKVSKAAPVGTEFTYQGRLIDANVPADGLYDFQFKLYDANVAGTQQGSTIDINDLDIPDGYFAVELDFGSTVFDGNAVWLETAVRPGDSNDPNAFVTLSPRQEVTAVPYALQTRGIFVDPNGNVGVGTTNPQALLQVGEGTFRVVRRPDNRVGVDEETPDAKLEITPGGTLTDLLMLSSTPDTDGDLLIVRNNGNVGIGTTVPSEKLHVVGNIRIVDGNQGANRVLTSDANGVASWQAPVLPRGVIVMWSGSISSIPEGWALCDGTNGTPDLRDRFIVGARQDHGDVAKTNITGSLTQTGGNVIHSHTGTTGSDTSGNYRAWDAPPGTSSWNGDASRGWHTHTLTINSSESIPPYYALAFIMKL